MNLLQLSWKNLLHKPWSTTLSVLLAALGAGLISLLLLVNHQLDRQFERNLAGIDLVLGAKGSPLQLVLNSMYHVDAPTGNIPLAESKAFLNPRHPYIEQAVPLSLGDSYRTYRIVGTTPTLLDFYDARLDRGQLWNHTFEVVLGASVARKLGLDLGDTFKSAHGFDDNEDLVHEEAEAFRVTGILKPSGTVLDQLILTANQSIWAVHEHAAEEEGHDHAHHFDLDKPLMEYPDRSITSILIRFKGTNVQTLNMQRMINENTNLQAATPAIEVARLSTNLGTGERALRWLAVVIMVVSVFSIFISLYSNLNERRYELAVMRTLGGSRRLLFGLLLLEGVLLAVTGCLLGLLLSHLGMAAVSQLLEETYRYDFATWTFLPEEIYLLAGAAVTGLLAALLPAVRAARTDIHTTLAEG